MTKDNRTRKASVRSYRCCQGMEQIIMDGFEGIITQWTEETQKQEA
jgi:hypothetical protein